MRADCPKRWHSKHGGGTVWRVRRTDDGDEGVGEHGRGDPSGPGGVAANLVLIESTSPFSAWKVSFTRHLDPVTRTSLVSGTG